VGRTLLSAAFDFLSSVGHCWSEEKFKDNSKGNSKGGGQECPPYTCLAPEVVLLSLLADSAARIAT